MRVGGVVYKFTLGMKHPVDTCIQMAYLGGSLCLFWLTFKPHTEFWILKPIPAFSACFEHTQVWASNY